MSIEMVVGGSFLYSVFCELLNQLWI